MLRSIGGVWRRASSETKGRLSYAGCMSIVMMRHAKRRILIPQNKTARNISAAGGLCL